MCSVLAHNVSVRASCVPQMFEFAVFRQVVVKEIPSANGTFTGFDFKANRHFVQNTSINFFNDFFVFIIFQNRQIGISGMDRIELDNFPHIEYTTDRQRPIVVHRMHRNVFLRFVRHRDNRTDEIFSRSGSVQKIGAALRNCFRADRAGFVHNVIVGGNIFSQNTFHFGNDCFVENNTFCHIERTS